MSTRIQTFDIAIVGGGIAGVLLTIGLQMRGVRVVLYESAHAFGGIGAGVVFHPNAVRALALLDPRVAAGYERVATFDGPMHSAWSRYRRGMVHRALEGADANAGQNELIEIIETPKGAASIHRASFLDEMVKLIPEDTAHFGKRLEGIDSLSDGRVKLHFRDGSNAVHDAVIGCDGIHSRTRQIVLGEDDPAAKAVFTGKYCYRGLVPMDRAVEVLGEDLARNSQMYIGYHGHIFKNPTEKGATVYVAAVASKETWGDPNWVVRRTKEDIERDFAHWSQHVRSLVALVEQTSVWALFHHPPARTYTRDRICLMGDAAHASTPYQGAGAGMAVEDAYVLSCLLAEVTNPGQIQSAFNAFEGVRKERTQKLVPTSAEAGGLYSFELQGFTDDVEKIAESIRTRMQWIWDEDVHKEYVEAKAIFNKDIDASQLLERSVKGPSS